MHRPRPVRGTIPLVTLGLMLAACGGAGSQGSGPATPPASESSETATTTASASQSADPSASAAPTDGASAVTAVMLGDMSFSPTELSVAVGTTVTFTNGSSLPHTITHGAGGQPADDAAFDRPISPDGGTVNVTFDEPGTYEITCKLHPSMQMRIVVEG